MSKEAMKLALEEMKIGNYNSAAERLEAALAEQPAQQQEPGRNHWEDGDVFERIAAMKNQPAQQQEPICKLFGTLPVYDRAAQRKPAQPQQETVAIIRKALEQGAMLAVHHRYSNPAAYPDQLDRLALQLAATPQPAQRQESAVSGEALKGRVCGYTPGMSRVELQLPEGTLIAGWLELGEAVYIAPQPAQRTWVGLTDEEREAVINNSMTPACVAIAIEAKLKEKNA